MHKATDSNKSPAGWLLRRGISSGTLLPYWLCGNSFFPLPYLLLV